MTLQPPRSVGCTTLYALRCRALRSYKSSLNSKILRSLTCTILKYFSLVLHVDSTGVPEMLKLKLVAMLKLKLKCPAINWIAGHA